MCLFLMLALCLYYKIPPVRIVYQNIPQSFKFRWTSNMKIISWLQCKLGNNNAGMMKEALNGKPCCLSMKPSWNNQQGYLKPENKSKLQTRNEFEDYLSANKEQNCVEDASEDAFPGFLSIGTLNMETMASEPGTPTFGFPADQEATHDEDNNEVNMEKEDNKLKLINEELEKLYKVESENEWFGESKRTTEDEAKAYHPLEGYLFASSYDFSNTNLSVHVEEKQDELKLVKYKKPTNPVRKLMDAFQPTSRKFNKIKQVFRRKVHPQELRSGKDSKSYNKCKIINGRSHGNLGTKTSERDTYTTMKTLKKSNDTNVEHWIRSDAEFLVLELGKN